jgi:hypothetical protein
MDTLATASPDVLRGVLHLEQRAQACTTVAALGFVIANETQALADYRQALVFNVAADGDYRLMTASGLASVVESSPFVVWLSRFSRTFPTAAGCHRLEFSAAPAEFREGWEEWLPDHLLVVPLHGPGAQRVGAVVYAREAAWTAADVALLERLHAGYGYCFAALGARKGLTAVAAGWLRRGMGRWLVLGTLAALLIPVRLSALGSAEVIALNAMAVAAPLDGVVRTVHVSPNAPVKAGELLFSLDDTALSSRKAVAQKALMIARSEALTAEQRAFDDVKSRGQLAAAVGQVREKEAELAAVDEMLKRVSVRAERDGVAIFADPNDWLGRPVQTGERVMQIADPGDAGVLIWLPVADALTLDKDAPIRLFLHTKPLSPVNARLLQTSYQAVLSPDGVSAYRLRGQFEADVAKPRIGLRGTARISGEWSVLGYYVLRRPIAAVREWSGW